VPEQAESDQPWEIIGADQSGGILHEQQDDVLELPADNRSDDEPLGMFKSSSALLTRDKFEFEKAEKGRE
jgi:hypothetical protein